MLAKPATKTKSFVVLLSDRDGFGFDERTLPPLVALVDAHSPDHREVTHLGVMASFETSADALRRVRSLVEAAEQLRHRAEFSSLGIGVASGTMIFASSGPIGAPANEASRLSAAAPDAYLAPLNELLREYRLV